MKLNIEKIKNNPIDSNCFIVYEQIGSDCLVIDAGSEDTSEIENFIGLNDLKPAYILLTHSHFDHVWSVDKLRKKYSCKLVCSQTCSENITNKKKNLSVFYNQVGFTLKQADIIINDNFVLEWQNNKITFFETPGHSKCSICIKINNNLFTGDTAIKDLKTVTKIVGGSKKELKISLDKLSEFISENTLFFGGHGENFNAEKFRNSTFI